MKTTTLACIAAVIATTALIFSCGPSYPGGLSEAEFKSLTPEKRAQLEIEQERADAARQANLERDMDRYEREREFNEVNKAASEPSVHLTKKQTRQLNKLTN